MKTTCEILLKTLFGLMIVSILPFSTYCQPWSQVTPYIPGGARSSPIYFTLNGKIYIGGGVLGDYKSQTQTFLSDFYEFNPATGQWATKAVIPQDAGSVWAVSLSVNNIGYILTGRERHFGTATKNVYKYDPVANQWSWTAYVPNNGRIFAFGFAINNKIYIGGGASLNYGFDGQPYPFDFNEYTIADGTWASKQSLPQNAIINGASFTINNIGYVAGGHYQLGQDWITSNTLISYNPTNNQWLTNLEVMPNPISGASGISLFDNGYVVGGVSNHPYSCCGAYTIWNSSTLCYNPGTGHWTFVGGVPYPAVHGALLRVNNIMYFGYGSYSTNCVNYTIHTELYKAVINNVDVTGNFLVCNSETYTMNNLPTSGRTILWTKSSNLSPNYGQGTPQYNVSRNVTFGNAWVNCKITYSGQEDVNVQKNLWIGPFEGTVVTGQTAVCPGYQYDYTAQVPGGHKSYYTYYWQYPSNWLYPNIHANILTIQVPQYNPQYGPVRVSINNDCSTSAYSGITVYPGYNCGHSFTYSPNPVEDQLTIEAVSTFDQPLTDSTLISGLTISYEALLINSSEMVVKKGTSVNNKIVFNVQGIPSGIYYLHINDNGNVLKEQILIK